jgi:PadR family transcriptional regulator, regulatory protein PadR
MFYNFVMKLKWNKIMNLENTKAQMRKGVLEFCILAILSNDEAYSTELLDKLKESKLLVVEGTIYPLLTRLKNDGLLSYRWEESSGGPPRKYYKITEVGKLFLEELKKTWDELSESVQKACNREK